MACRAGVQVTVETIKVAFFLAYKSILRGNHWALALTILVMALSFVNLIFTAALLNGVMTTLDDSLVQNLLSNVSVNPTDNKSYLENAEELEARIGNYPGVAAASIHLNSWATFDYKWKEKRSPFDKDKTGRWDVIGIDPSQEARVTAVHGHLIAGSYLDEGDRDQILLGVEIAGGPQAQSSSFLTLDGVQVGDKVRLTYPNGVQREYTVKGIFRGREMFRSDNLSFVTRKEMASVMGRPLYADRASQILVRTAPGVDELDVAQRFREAGIGGVVRTWHDYGGAMRSMVSTFDIIASVLGAVGLGVAAIVMFIVVYISVVNRRRQIGVLRAIGLKQNIIIGSYLIQALVYAVCGTAIGYLIMQQVAVPYFIANPLPLPIGMVSLNMVPDIVYRAVYGLIGAAVLAGFIPSWAIMRQSLIKAIWG